MDERHKDDGPARCEQNAFVDDFVGQRLLPVWLSDDDKIKAAAEAANLVGSTGNAGADRAGFP
jgi:hypothetical protein